MTQVMSTFTAHDLLHSLAITEKFTLHIIYTYDTQLFYLIRSMHYPEYRQRRFIYCVVDERDTCTVLHVFYVSA